MMLINTYTKIIFLALLILFVIVLIVLFLNWYIPKKISSYIESLDSQISNYYAKSFYEEKDFTDILDSTEKLQSMLGKLKLLKYFPYIWHSKKFTSTLD